MHGDHDPFAAGAADLGFVCSPSFLYLRSLSRPSVDLVPAGFVFRDTRHDGSSPVYYSDVVVRADDAAEAFDDLRGRTWGYNDECSLSGYFATLQHLRSLGCPDDFFAQRVRTGSHLASIEAVLAGGIDAAAIDSTALALWRKEREGTICGLRIVASWGPFPIQPIVVRRTLDPTIAAAATRALLALDCAEVTAAGLCQFGLERIVATDEAAYAEERRQLCALGQIPEAS
ncbi:MAG: PhnD/SsuA/transferrin family substrate-binding protein [Planctomycetes bacterium]|nr:PhnD/SsuA/transferrin family substrate-binding protein [Planctomycetota bacterium]